jgi:arsenate reductase
MKIYHNPRCSKSRETLNIILEHNIKPEIHLYLNDPLSTEEIKYILKLLKTSADQIIRKNEEIYKTYNLKNADEDTLIEMINKNPILLERPIVVSKSQAIIGRPPENVRQLISNIA